MVINADAVATLAGRVFHACAAVAWNEWSPTVRSCICGTISHWRQPEQAVIVVLLLHQSSTGHGRGVEVP